MRNKSSDPEGTAQTATPVETASRNKTFEEWYSTQRCIGYPECNGDLEGLGHVAACPRAKTQTMVTLRDAWNAGRAELESQLTQVRAELEPLLKRLMATTIHGAMLQLDDHFAGDARLAQNLRDHVGELTQVREELHMQERQHEGDRYVISDLRG